MLCSNWVLLGGDDTHEKTNGTNPSTSKLQTVIKKEEEKEVEKSSENLRPTIILHSHKMKELKDLLLAEKLNTHAISLHLTAQSQVQVGKKTRGEPEGNNLRPKRARRE